MRRRLLGLLVICAACGKPKDEGPLATEPQDLLTTAFGGCTATGTERDRDLGEISLRTREYNDDGDMVRSVADYSDDDRFYDWEITYTVGSIHQTERLVTTYTRADGWTTRYTWEGGQIVREKTDDASDGSVDEIGTFEYDGDHMVRWEWDINPEGTIDDFADFEWTPDGAGWTVVADGEDPNGPYLTEEQRDSKLRSLNYHYEDSTGYVRDWTIDSYSELDIPGDITMTDRQDGEIVLEDEEIHLFDEQGRMEREVHEKAEYESGVFQGSLKRTIEWSYACP